MGNGKGFSGVNTLQDFVFADNASFDGTLRGGGLATNGQLWIGQTTADRPNDSGHVKVGSLTSPNNTITIGYSSPNITLDLAGGGMGIDTLTPDSGTSPVVPDGAGNINLSGNGSITTVGGLNTLDVELTGLTNHAVLIGAGTSTITKVGPVASTGAVLQSNGVGSDPGFSTATYPSIATGTGTILRADGTNWVPSTATYPDTAGTSGNVLTSNGTNWTSAAPASVGFTWTDTSGAFSPLKDNGYFITGTATGTLPASPAQGDTIKFFVDHASQLLTIDAPGTQIIRMGNTVTSAGGTFVSSAQGDACELVYRTSDTCWCATSFVGNWSNT